MFVFTDTLTTLEFIPWELKSIHLLKSLENRKDIRN